MNQPTQTPMPKQQVWNLEKRNQLAALQEQEKHFHETVIPKLTNELETLGLGLNESQVMFMTTIATEIIALLKPFSR